MPCRAAASPPSPERPTPSFTSHPQRAVARSNCLIHPRPPPTAAVPVTGDSTEHGLPGQHTCIAPCASLSPLAPDPGMNIRYG